MLSTPHLTLSLRHSEISNNIPTLQFLLQFQSRIKFGKEKYTYLLTYLLLRENFTSTSFFAMKPTLRTRSLEQLIRNLNPEILLIDIASTYNTGN